MSKREWALLAAIGGAVVAVQVFVPHGETGESHDHGAMDVAHDDSLRTVRLVVRGMT